MRGEARRGEARRGEARRGEARRDETRRDETRRDVCYYIPYYKNTKHLTQSSCILGMMLQTVKPADVRNK